MSDNTLGLSDIAEGACEFPFLGAMYDNPRIGFRALPVRAVLVFYWDVIGGLAFGFARCGLVPDFLVSASLVFGCSPLASPGAGYLWCFASTCGVFGRSPLASLVV